MQLEDIKKLAIMARIDMDDTELAEMAKDFDSILAYVDQIKEFSDSTDSSPKQGLGETGMPVLFNVMREDTVTNESGVYTEKILAEMPAIQDGYLKVKQIL
jgi:aspartyl-tRNA(Asn)/glutamyl-tRNA(Gln) amidotransferase subunit C